MQCLDKCQNHVLDFFIGEGDKGVPLYRCAQAAAGSFNVREIADACHELEELGLLRDIGTTTKVLKLSSAGLGDVRTGYFADQGQGGDGLAAMQTKLQNLERKHEEAVRDAAQLQREVGGLAKHGRK